MLNQLPIQPDQPVPVYDCHVIVSGPDADGKLHGIISNLPELTAWAKDERALLRKLVDQFKDRLREYHRQQVAIPFQPKATPQPGERQRWIPVHL